MQLVHRSCWMLLQAMKKFALQWVNFVRTCSSIFARVQLFKIRVLGWILKKICVPSLHVTSSIHICLVVFVRRGLTNAQLSRFQWFISNCFVEITRLPYFVTYKYDILFVFVVTIWIPYNSVWHLFESVQTSPHNTPYSLFLLNTIHL